MAPGVIVTPIERLERRRDASCGPNPRGARRRREEPLHRLRHLRHAEKAPVEPVVRELALWQREQRLHAASVHESDAKLSVREQRAQRGERFRQLRVTGQTHATRVGHAPIRRGRRRRQPLLRRLLGPPPGPVGAVARRGWTVYQREPNLRGSRGERRAEAFDELAQRGDPAQPRLRQPLREPRTVRRPPRAQLRHERGGFVLVAVEHLPRRRRRREVAFVGFIPG